MVSENTAPGMGHISNELEQPRLQLLIPYVDGFLPRHSANASTGSTQPE
jgi:hypothetical protein